MRKFFGGLVAIILLLCIMLSTIGNATETAKERTGAKDGQSSVFYVTSNGKCKVTLKQEKGECRELSYENLISGLTGSGDEWGKYHIYCSNMATYSYNSYEWDDSYWSSSFSFTINGSGLYKIEIVPYTADEMTNSYINDVFLSWTVYPHWWVESCSNGSYQAQNPCSNNVYVEYRSTNGTSLHSEYLSLTPGTHSVSPNYSPYGYSISGNTNHSVTVNSYGIANQSYIVFYYTPDQTDVSITVYCNYGNQSKTVRETLSNSGYIYAPDIYGYTCNNSPQYVNVNNGYASPSTVYFYYSEDVPNIVTPIPHSIDYTPNNPLYAGKVVTMGNYPQDRNGTFSSPIEWYVIKVEGNNALLLSKMCLDAMPFDNSLRSWESSSIKSWLNGDFTSRAFNASERNALNYYSPANATVFLLSKSEVEYYLSTDIRKGYTTAFANSSNTKGKFPATVGKYGYAMWWLRDDGTDYGASMCVRADADVSITTRGMDRDRDYYTVRPAIWVDTTRVNLR